MKICYSNPNGPPTAPQPWKPLEPNSTKYYSINLEKSRMSESFCNGRPKKWREILEPCKCGERICSINDLEALQDDNNNEKRPLIALPTDLTQFRILEKYTG